MSSVGDAISANNADWTFEGDVCKTFDQHVSRSVPFYNEGHDLVCKISDYFLPRGAACYDLGCSVGMLLKRLAQQSQGRDVTFRGIDSVQGMVDEARKVCAEYPNITIEKGDIVNMQLEKSNFIVCYYTMQFVHPSNRQKVFDQMFESLEWGGGLLLFEKVRGPDARFQDMMSGIYTDYKLDQGFTPDEIVSKAKSLKGVLEPFSTQGNIDLMTRAGFVDIMTVMKYVSFECFLAIK